MKYAAPFPQPLPSIIPNKRRPDCLYQLAPQSSTASQHYTCTELSTSLVIDSRLSSLTKLPYTYCPSSQRYRHSFNSIKLGLLAVPGSNGAFLSINPLIHRQNAIPSAIPPSQRTPRPIHRPTLHASTSPQSTQHLSDAYTKSTSQQIVHAEPTCINADADTADDSQSPVRHPKSYPTTLPYSHQVDPKRNPTYHNGSIRRAPTQP